MEVTNGSQRGYIRMTFVSDEDSEGPSPDAIGRGVFLARAQQSFVSRGMVPLSFLSACSSFYDGRWAHCVHILTEPGDGYGVDSWLMENLPDAWSVLPWDAFMRWVEPNGPQHHDSVSVH